MTNIKTVLLSFLCISLAGGALYAEITTKRIDGILFKTLIYYKDGREVAREVTDRDGNIETTGKVPNEYFTRQRYRQEPQPPTRQSKEPVKQQALPAKKAFSPFEGKVSLAVNSAPRIAWTNQKKFSEFRTGKVLQYRQLDIYPSDYDPFTEPHASIYNALGFGKHWTSYSQFYVSNPYLLIMLSKSKMIKSFEDYCGLAEVSYENGVFEEVYAGAKVAQFFAYSELCDAADPDIPRVVTIWTVNAQDAGFPYITIDRTKCQNIDFSWNDSPYSIANSVYSVDNYYHGSEEEQLNDISDLDPRASLLINKSYKYTCIYIKLWKESPSSKEDPEDLAYVIKVIP